MKEQEFRDCVRAEADGLGMAVQFYKTDLGLCAGYIHVYRVWEEGVDAGDRTAFETSARAEAADLGMDAQKYVTEKGLVFGYIRFYRSWTSDEIPAEFTKFESWNDWPPQDKYDERGRPGKQNMKLLKNTKWGNA